MPCSPDPRRRADWGEAVTALARRGLTVNQAGRELGFRTPHAAHYHAPPGSFRGRHMAAAREWIEALPPREAVTEALALIDALTVPVAIEPLDPWPGLRLPNMRFVRLLGFLHGRAHLDDESRPVHWSSLRAVIHQDVIDWHAADQKEVRGYTIRLNRMLQYERCDLNTRVADLVPLARPWGRIRWRDSRVWLEMGRGVPPPWADHQARSATDR